MKPTAEQKLWLKDYRYQVMEYRETYEEIYDHMLLAVEHAPQKEFFESVVVDIIENDFGGNNGLLELEERCRQTAETTARAQYRTNFKKWFISPLVVFTMIIFVLLFQLQHIKGAGIWMGLFFSLLLLTPFLILALRGFGLGYKYRETKTSAKDEIFRRIAFFRSNSRSNRRRWRIFWRIYAINWVINFFYGPIRWWLFGVKPTNTHSMRLPVTGYSMMILTGISSIILTLLIIHIFAVIKLYYSEIKTQMIVN